MARRTNPMKILYLDIETTPHSGSFWNLFPKYIPINQVSDPTYLLCWAAKWEGSREVMFESTRNHAHMVQSMWELLDEADAVCHYNGKSFDMKHLNREFAKVGLPPPRHYNQIDLLSVVRQNFKLASNKLDWVVQYFGLGAKVKHQGIELWYGCMENKAKDWKVMEKYNRMDVVLLPKLYKFLLPWIKNHPNVGLFKEGPKPTCCQCGSTNLLAHDDDFHTKTLKYQAYTCNTCSTQVRSNKSTLQPQGHLTVRVN